MTNRDALSPHVRIVEAEHHLSEAQSALAEEDNELVDLIAELRREVNAVGQMVEETHKDTTDPWRRRKSP